MASVAAAEMRFTVEEIIPSTHEAALMTPSGFSSFPEQDGTTNVLRTNTRVLNSSAERSQYFSDAAARGDTPCKLNRCSCPLVGVVLSQLFPSLIAPFLLPRDVAQVALVSRALYHITQRPQTWKHMAVVFFDTTPDAVDSLETFFLKLHRTEMVSCESNCNNSNGLTEGCVQAVNVRRTELPSELSQESEELWVLEGKSMYPAAGTSFLASETCTTVENSWDRQEVSALVEEEEKKDEKEKQVLSLHGVHQRYGKSEQECEEEDGFLALNFCSVDSHLMDSFGIGSDMGSLPVAIHSCEGNIFCDVRRTNKWSTHDSPLPLCLHYLPHYYESHDVEELYDNPLDEMGRSPLLQLCERCGSLPLPHCCLLDININDSRLFEALHCWTSVEGESESTCEQLLVCAATMNRTRQQSHEPFPWKAYYKTLYERRVGSFLRSLRCLCLLSQRALFVGEVHEAVEHLTSVVNTICQGGCAMSGRGTGTVVCMELCRTLRLRARLYHQLGMMEAAYNDMCLAHLLNHDDNSKNNNDEISDETAMALLFSFIPEVASNGEFKCAPSCLECEYSQVSVQQDIFHQGAFLQRWFYHHGPSVLLYLHQYMICDALEVRAPHLLQRAAECATTYERVLVQAWNSYDRGQTESAMSEAELAVSMLPLSFRIHAEQASAALRPLLANPAEEELLLFLQSNPSSQSQSPTAVFAYYTLGFMLQAVPGVGTAALSSFLALSHSATHRAAALRLLAHDYAERGNTRGGVSLLSIALHLTPNAYSLYSLLARQQMMAGDKLAAYATLSTAIQRCHPIPAEAFVQRSQCRLLDPLLDVNEATGRDPRLSYPYQIRAAMRMDRGDSEAAIAEVSRIITLTSNPNDILLRSCFRLDSGNQPGVLEDLALLVLLAPQQEIYREWFLFSAEIFSGSENDSGKDVDITTTGCNGNEHSSDEAKGLLRRNAAGLAALFSALDLCKSESCLGS